MTIIASGTVSRIDSRCASRASGLLARRAQPLAEPRNARTQQREDSDPRPFGRKQRRARLDQMVIRAGQREVHETTLSAVASSPGPRPPSAPAIRTAGTKNR